MKRTQRQLVGGAILCDAFSHNKKQRLYYDVATIVTSAELSPSQSLLFYFVPHEVTIHILSYLEYTWLVTRATLINKQFHSWIYEKSFWKILCENQSVVLYGSNSGESSSQLEQLKFYISQLQFSSVTISDMNVSLAQEFIGMVAPFVEDLTLVDHTVPHEKLSFPKLRSVYCLGKDGTSELSKKVLDAYCAPGKISHLGVNFVDQCQQYSGVTELTFGKVRNWDKLLLNNLDTLERVIYLNLDTTWQGPFEKVPEETLIAFLKCRKLSYMKAKELFFDSRLVFTPVVFENLTEIEFKVSTKFMSQFFAVQHPKLKKLTMCIYGIDEGVDLSFIQPLEHLEHLSFFIGIPAQVETEFIGQFLQRVTPKLPSLSLACQSRFDIRHFTQFTNCKHLGFFMTGVIHLIEPLAQQNMQNLETITIGFLPSFHLPLITVSMFIKVVTLRRIPSNQESEFLACLPNLVARERMLQVASYFNHSQPERISADIIDLEESDLFFMLPSVIYHVDIKVKSQITIDEWILFTICCHHVKEFYCLNEQTFPLFELVQHLRLGFDQVLFSSLKTKYYELLNSDRLVIREEQRRKIKQDYDILFATERSFSRHRYDFPAINYLYKLAKLSANSCIF
jgi:hypothetical protein